MSTVTQPKPTRKSIPRKREHEHVAESLRDSRPDPEDLEIAAEVAALRAEREEDERQITLIPIANLERHPHNRIIDPADPSIDQLAESLRANGQLEPMRVRMLRLNRYQLISGERRYTAMQRVGITTARCIIVNVDEATALREVAVANSNREDLNPIQRAELMQQLMKPREHGGSGLSLIDAGKLFGLNSESGCKNALRILKLPDKIRTLVANRELPERVARTLVPYAACPPVMKQLVKEIDDDLEGTIYDLRGDDVPWWLRQTIEDDLRPIDARIERNYGWDKGRFGCLFEWKEHEAKLQIVELPYPIGKKIELVKFAMNIKLWDKLNDPLVAEALAKKEKQSKGKASNTKVKKLTPAEEKAEAKRKAKEQDEGLDRYSREWASRLLRCHLSDWHEDDTLVTLTLPWLVGECASYDLRRIHHQALIECRMLEKKASKNGWGQLDTLTPLVASFNKPTISRAEVARLMGTFWRIILWPVSKLIGESKSELTPSGQLPDKLFANLSLQQLGQLVQLSGTSFEDAWKAAAVDDSDERRLVSAWLMRHTKAQLQQLTVEIPTGGMVPHAWEKRDLLVAHILAAHKPGKPLPLPKRLQKLFK